MHLSLPNAEVGFRVSSGLFQKSLQIFPVLWNFQALLKTLKNSVLTDVKITFSFSQIEMYRDAHVSVRKKIMKNVRELRKIWKRGHVAIQFTIFLWNAILFRENRRLYDSLRKLYHLCETSRKLLRTFTLFNSRDSINNRNHCFAVSVYPIKLALELYKYKDRWRHFRISEL